MVSIATAIATAIDTVHQLLLLLLLLLLLVRHFVLKIGLPNYFSRYSWFFFFAGFSYFSLYKERYCKLPLLLEKLVQSTAFEVPQCGVKAIKAPLTQNITREVALLSGVRVSDYRGPP